MRTSPSAPPRRDLAHLVTAIPWLLAAAGLALAIWGFSNFDGGTSTRVAIYRSIQLIGLEDAASGEGGWQLDIARFILPIAAIWLTAEAFTRLFVIFRDNRFGTLRARNHAVVCGYGRTGQAIIEGLRDRSTKVVLIRREAVAALRGPVPTVRGDARDERILRQARIAYAREVWVACGDDNINAEVATQITEMTRGKRSPPAINFGIREARLHRELRMGGSLWAFNLNAVAARQMVAKMAAADVAVAVAGFGKLGQAVAAELAGKPVTQIFAWDRRGEAKAAEVLRRRGRQLAGPLVGVDVDLEYDDLFKKCWGASIGAVFVCLNDDAINAAVAYEIAERFPDAMVCARVSTTQQGIGKLVVSASTASGDSRVHFIGFHDAAKDLPALRSQMARTSAP